MLFKLDRTIVYCFFATFPFFFFSGCNNSNSKYSIDTELNPYKISPLTALLKIKSKEPCKVSYEVLGETTIKQSFELLADSLSIPVVGLYPGKLNNIVVSLKYEGKEITDTVKIKTANVPSYFPQIKIDKINRDKMEQGLHGCDIHYANNGKFRSVPMIFDDQGKVRWYLDLSFSKKMTSPFQRLKDGTLLMVDRHIIYEFDMLGKIIKQTQINTNYGMHHDVLELPNSDLLICVGKRNVFANINGEKTKTDSDFIIYYNRKTFKIEKEWDLAKHLDVSRSDLNFFKKGDWLHMNGLAFDKRDSTIVVSGKNLGLIKISWDDKLKWILAPKKNWGKSGRNNDGINTQPFLLTAVDANGKKYSNNIQLGEESHPDFDFSWSQHSPTFLPNGNLLAFDNGVYRNFDKKKTFSRAVEYEINDTELTVKQVWQYGKERNRDFFSIIVSDVDYLPNTKNILVTSGFLTPKVNHSAKIVEVDYETGEELFEATLYYKNANGNRKPSWGQSDLLYRSERMKLEY